MRRRSTASSKVAKARGRKGKTLRAVLHSTSSVASQETEAARFQRERDEALERETATSEVLRLISKSPGDLHLVFRSILQRATRICEAKFGNIYRFDGKLLHFAAGVGTPAQYAAFQRQRGPFNRRLAVTSIALSNASTLATRQTPLPNLSPDQQSDLVEHDLS